MLEVAASVAIFAAEEGELETKCDSPAAREERLGRELHRLEGLLYSMREWREATSSERSRLLSELRQRCNPC